LGIKVVIISIFQIKAVNCIKLTAFGFKYAIASIKLEKKLSFFLSENHKKRLSHSWIAFSTFKP